MTRLFNATVFYVVTGLLAGLYYREFTKRNDFPEGRFTQLGVVHTHLLALGFLFMVIVLLLERSFALTSSRLFTWFFWTYNVGVVLTVAMLIWHGSLTVLGKEASPAISGIAGLGHIVLTAGLILFLVNLGQSIKRSGTPAVRTDPAPVAR